MVKRINKFWLNFKHGGLSNSQRNMIAEKIMEWGNLIFVGLVIGQVVPGSNEFRLPIAAVGLFIMLLAYLFAYVTMRKGRRKK